MKSSIEPQDESKKLSKVTSGQLIAYFISKRIHIECQLKKLKKKKKVKYVLDFFTQVVSKLCVSFIPSLNHYTTSNFFFLPNSSSLLFNENIIFK